MSFDDLHDGNNSDLNISTINEDYNSCDIKTSSRHNSTFFRF